MDLDKKSIQILYGIDFPPLRRRNQNQMQTLFQSLNHLVEPTFDDLDHESLARCMKVSTVWNTHLSPILANPIFIQNRRDKQLLEIKNTMKKLHNLFFSPLAKPKCHLFHKAFQPRLVREILNPNTFDYRRAIKFIIEKIQDSNFETYWKRKSYTSALQWSIDEGHFLLAKFIVEYSPEKNPMVEKTKTALHLAAEKGHYNLVVMIANKIENKNPKDNSGNTPLHKAAQYGYFDTVAFLLKNVYDKNPSNEDGTTPLHHAARNGHFQIVKKIAEQLVDKNPEDAWGNTPRTLALNYGMNPNHQYFDYFLPKSYAQILKNL